MPHSTLNIKKIELFVKLPVGAVVDFNGVLHAGVNYDRVESNEAKI
ncbi:MAG: hypothetical protein P8M80_12370 [Pirellulaceae bacterium]|nr:hypothetical protein [Pirellulaceae bacterium]